MLGFSGMRREERNGKGGRETFRRQGMGRKMGGTEMKREELGGRKRKIEKYGEREMGFVP